MLRFYWRIGDFQAAFLLATVRGVKGHALPTVSASLLCWLRGKVPDRERVARPERSLTVATPERLIAGRNRGQRLRQEAWEGGKRLSNITEIFRRNAAGNQSRLVEPGPQPEASLAWGGEIRTAKRRQRVLMPCDGAPKLSLVESPRRTQCVGPCRPTAIALSRSGRARRGLRRGRRHMRVPQELCEARIVSRRHSPELETGLRTPGPRLCVLNFDAGRKKGQRTFT
jgi:hypothetical protein